MDPPPFPSDVLLDILTRFHMKLVGKCRVLSKEFNQATYESYFKTSHAQQTSIASGFLLQSMFQSKYIFTFVSAENYQNIEFSLNFLPGREPEILAVAAHGLVLCQTEDPSRTRIPIYCICKPMTKEWKQLPNPRTRYFTIQTAMAVVGSNPLRYKIVRFSRPNSTNERRPQFTRVHCEVFDSETWRWRQLEDVKLRLGTFFLFHSGVWVSGAVHWQLSDDTIFGFRLEEERWSRFALPDPIRMKGPKSDIMTLAEYEGKLALIRMAAREATAEWEHSMEVWVMEQYRRKVWNRMFVVSNEGLDKERYFLPMAFYSSEIAVLWSSDRLIFSKFKGSCCSVTLSEQQSHVCAPKIFPFWSDFEPCSFVGISFPPRARSKKKKITRITDADEGEEDGDGSHSNTQDIASMSAIYFFIILIILFGLYYLIYFSV